MIKLCAFSDEYSPSLDKQIEGLKLNNIKYMEIRGVNGKNVLDLSLDEAKDIANILDQNNIKVWSIGSPIGKVDINTDINLYYDKVHHICKLANIFKCNNIRMFSFFNAYDKKDLVIKYLNEFVKIGKLYNVYLNHENEKDIYGDTVLRVLELYNNVDGLKFVYDPANFIQCNVDSNYALDNLFNITNYFHIKDAMYVDGSVVPSGYGDGNINRLISMINKDIILSIEPHLFDFVGYKDIDNTKLINKFTFNDNYEAFNYAVKSLKDLLINNGYIETKDGFTKNKIKYGIIGVGNIGTAHLRNIMENKLLSDSIVTAVADLKQEKLNRVINMYPNHKFDTYLSGEDLIEHANVDAVIVAVPHYGHPSLAIKALQKDIHVIVEKPAGVYTKQVKEMNDVALKSNALFTMMFNQRTNSIYRKMKELIANNEIGTIKRINWLITNWYRSQSYYDSGDWRATWEGEGGGVLFNQCPHQLDLLQWVTNMMPKKVRAFCHYGKWHDIEVEDDVTAYLEYDNGATGVFVTSTADTPGTNRFEVLGTLGKIVCENDELVLYKNEIDERDFNQTYKGGFGEPKYSVKRIETDGLNLQHVGIVRNFNDAILGKDKLFVNGIEGLNGVILMNAMELSGWLDKMIDLPFDDDLYLEILNEKIKNSKIKKEECNVVLDTTNTY